MRSRSLILLGLAALLGAIPLLLFQLGRIHPTVEGQYWKRLKFGRWTFAESDGSFVAQERALSTPEFTYRLESTKLLVALFREGGFNQPADYSLNQFSVDLKSGRVGQLSRAEWNAGLPVGTHIDSPFHEPLKLTNNEAIYQSRRFTGRGKSLGGWALSPDGNWLALWSWDGENPQPKGIFDITIARGRLFIDVYRVSSGKRITELSSFFFPIFPDRMVRSISWIADRYLMVPMPDRQEAWLCDLRPTEPLSTASWDVVRPGAEILGFADGLDASSGEPAQAAGRFVAVRVSEQQSYALNRFGSRSDWMTVLDPGIRRMPIIRMPGDRVQGVELRGPKGRILAAVDDLGPATDYGRTWQPGGKGAAISAVPYIGSGPSQTFEFVLLDMQGPGDIAKSEFLIQGDRTQAAGCLFMLEPSKGILTLLDDGATSPVGTLPVPGIRVLHNNQCAISSPVVSTESGQSIVLRVNVQFSPRFSGRKNVYSRVEDLAGESTNWQWLASWIVPQS